MDPQCLGHAYAFHGACLGNALRIIEKYFPSKNAAAYMIPQPPPDVANALSAALGATASASTWKVPGIGNSTADTASTALRQPLAIFAAGKVELFFLTSLACG
jgi:hypothetical protein